VDYKAYLSSLFYLTEAIKYLSPEQRAITINQIVTLCRQGFLNTNVFGFKVYEVFYDLYPQAISYNKTFLNKNKGVFYLQENNLTNPQWRPRCFYGQEAEEGFFELETTLDLVNGPVMVKVVFDDSEDQAEYSGYWQLRLQFDNYKNYTEADMRLLMDQLRGFIPNRA
jgi:hypothetical protein